MTKMMLNMLAVSRPLELDLALEILEEDEILKQNVSSEVAVTQLKVHQLQRDGKFALC